MTPVATPAEMRDIDHAAIEGGTSLHTLVERAGAEDPAVAEDEQPVAGLADLRQQVARQQHGPALGPGVQQTVLEHGLHERVEPGRRFVEDEQFGRRGERGDQRHLLPVALGVGADALCRIKLEALDQRCTTSGVESAAQPSEQVDDLTAGECRPQGHIAWHVGQTSMKRNSIAPSIHAEDGHRARPRMYDEGIVGAVDDIEIGLALIQPDLAPMIGGRGAHDGRGVQFHPAAIAQAVGAIGDDGEAFDVCRGLNRLGCSTESLLRCPELMTPTYLKPCDRNVVGLAGEHSRYDTKNRVPTPSSIVDRIAAELERVLPSVDALIVMDQVELPDCGVVTAVLRDHVAEFARRFPKVLFWADSRRFIRKFRNVTIKANQFEAIHKLNPAVGEEVSLEELRRVLPEIRQEIGASVFITCAERGILAGDSTGTLVPGVRVKGPIDPTGAGDSATAGAVLALSSGATPVEAALMANLVASVTVQQLGTTGSASPEQVCEAWAEWTRQQAG